MSDAECGQITNSYCDSSSGMANTTVCACQFEYIADPANDLACIPRVINNVCTNTSQCLTGKYNFLIRFGDFQVLLYLRIEAIFICFRICISQTKNILFKIKNVIDYQ